jgi:hypothetical protein
MRRVWDVIQKSAALAVHAFIIYWIFSPVVC